MSWIPGYLAWDEEERRSAKENGDRHPMDICGGDFYSSNDRPPPDKPPRSWLWWGTLYLIFVLLLVGLWIGLHA